MNSLMDKRFVIFDGTLMQGGAERVISILSHHMKEQGYNVEILLLHNQEIFYDIDKRIKITSVEKETGSKNIVRNLFWIRKFFKTHGDIIISFLAPFNIVALVSHFGLKSKIIVADRNDPRYVPSNHIVRKLRDFLYRFADGIVLQTTYNKKYFSSSIQKKSVVISNPIDLGPLKREGLYAEKEDEIVSVGRLMPQKNQKMLLDAFARIADKYPDYELTIYGEGPEREALELQAEQLGISNRFNLPGSVKDLHERMLKSKLFVLSSNYEGMPNALIEAMCLGLPCISTQVSGATDLITPGENGELVDEGDTENLARIMNELLHDPSRMERYAVNAARTNELLEVGEIMSQWIDYLSCL